MRGEGKDRAGDNNAGDNSATVAAQDAGRPEHSRAGDAVTGGVGKRTAQSKADWEASAFGTKSDRGPRAAAAKAKAMAVG